MLGTSTPNGPQPRRPGVYAPREDSELLLPFARIPRRLRVLDIGTGSGILAVAAASSGARVVATDRNLDALRAARELARKRRVDLDCVRTDLARGLRAFDRILCNPPYLPTPVGLVDPEPGDRLALDGGATGLTITRRLLSELSPHLRPRGSAFVLFSTLQDPTERSRLLDGWMRRGGRWRVVARRELEGERLEVVRFSRGASRAARRAGSGRRKSAGRRRTRPARRSESNRDGGRGRRHAPGGASSRRRSPRGS